MSCKQLDVNLGEVHAKFANCALEVEGYMVEGARVA